MVIFETERLIIRKFSIDDWKDLYEYLSDESVVKYEPYDVLSEEACRQEAKNRSENPAFLAVCLKESSKLIGNLYFEQQGPKEFLTWELGYVFNPAYQHKGYATESCREIICYAFEHFKAHRIIAMCNPENSASWRLMERLQMRREGYFKKKAFFKRDEKGEPIWHDSYEYGLLAEEYHKK